MKKCIPIFVIMICLCLVIVKEMGIINFRQEKVYEPFPVNENIRIVQEEILTSENKGLDIPYEWNETISENNTIHAVIDIPEQIRQEGFKAVEAKLHEQDEQSVLSVLHEDYEPYKEMENELLRQYVGKDEMYFFFEKKYGTISMTCHMDDYIRMAYRDQLSSDYNRDKYRIEEDVEGFSIEECDVRIYELWNTLGLEDELQIIHRALDYEIMKEEAIELHPDGERTRPEYNWGVKDNSYHCSVYQSCNGIPILESYHLNFRNDILNVASHIFVINKNRFISMSTDTMYTLRYRNEQEKLITFEEALNKYRKSSELELKDYSLAISRIGMRVIAIPEGEENYKMLPVWIFYGTQKDDIGEYPYAMIIDALTGEEL